MRADGVQVEEPRGGKCAVEVLGKHAFPSDFQVLWGAGGVRSPGLVELQPSFRLGDV